MANLPNPEPFKTLCIQQGFLTATQAEELANLQRHLAEALGIPNEFLELAVKKSFLTEAHAKRIRELAAQAGEGATQRRGLKELAGFEIIGKCGEGAMGVVFRARQKSLDREVALKILPPNLAKNRTFVDRFIREARASAALNHPNIVQGIDVGENKGLYYFAMEFIEGETALDRFKREGPLPLDDVIEIGRQTALALAHAHAKGMIHRDIKPDNLMLARAASSSKKAFTVKVMDLGLARMVENDGSLTETGKALGTPHYLSPEQARGQHDLTGACDLYALGGTMLHLASGKTPYSGSTAAVIMAAHLTEPPPDPKAHKPDMPPDIAAVIRKLLAKKPEDRYPSADALAEDLQRVQNGERTKFVQAGRGLGKSTGPVRPVTTAKGVGAVTTGARRPVTGSETTNQQPATKLNGPVLALAGGAALILIGLVAAFGFSGSSRPPEEVKAPAPEKTTAPVQKVAKPDEPKGPTPEEIAAAERKKTEEEAAARRKRLETLKQEALQLAEADPGNLKGQRAAWTHLRNEAVGTDLATFAAQELAKLETRLQDEARKAAASVIEEARKAAAGGDYAGALAQLNALNEEQLPEDAREQRHAAIESIEAQARETGGKLLAEAGALAESGRKDQALKLFEEAGAFKFAAIAEAAKLKAEALRVVIEQERMEAELAAATRFGDVVRQISELLGERKLDDAQTELRRALNDLELRPRADALRGLQDALGGIEPLAALAGRRLAGTDGKGLVLPGSEAIFYRIENGRLYFKPTAAFPQETSKGLEYVSLRDLTALAGLRDEKAAERLGEVPVEQIPALGGLLALLGEPAAARALFERGRADGGEALAKRLQAWDGALEVVELGAVEAGAAARFKALVSIVGTGEWKKAHAALTALRAEPYGGTEFVKSHGPQLQALEEKVMHALADVEADAIPVTSLFKGKATRVGGDLVELTYDFQDPAQLGDFVVKQGNWTLKDGILACQHPPNDGILWLRAPFTGNNIEVVFAGQAKMDLNVLLGPEITADTTAGYSFRFGRTNNRGSELVTFDGKVLAKSDAKLVFPKNNLVSVVRNGNTFVGTLNAAPEILRHSEANPHATRHVALQTWEWMRISSLKIVGRVDPDWIKARKKEIFEGRMALKQAGENVRKMIDVFHGRLSPVGKESVRLAYDFQDPKQVEDFVGLGESKLVAQRGVASFAGHGQIVYHRARWLPPLTWEIEASSGHSITFAFADQAQSTDSTRAGREAVRLTTWKDKITLVSMGRRVKQAEGETGMSKLVKFLVHWDGKEWIVSLNGKEMLRWTSPKPFDPHRDNYWALVNAFGTNIHSVSVTGKIDPVWMQDVLDGKGAPLPFEAAQEQVAEKKEGEGELQQPQAVARPEEKPPEAKVLRTLQAAIQARLRWQDSRIQLEAGTPVRITATGEWRESVRSNPCTADGYKDKELDGRPLMALMMRCIGGNEGDIDVGAHWEGKWPGGKAMFQANQENGKINQAVGGMQIKVEVLEKMR